MFDLTIMIYMAGDNSLNGKVLPEIIEMERGVNPDNEKIAFVVQADGGAFHENKWPFNGAIRGRLSHNVFSEEQRVASEFEIFQDESDFSDPAVLLNFAEYTLENYSAHNYMLFLWSHGYGIDDSLAKGSDPIAELFGYLSLKGTDIKIASTLSSLQRLFLTWKDTETISLMSTEEIKGALEDSGGTMSNEVISSTLKSINSLLETKLLILAFDACLMGGIEIAEQVKENAYIFIASENVVPGTGFDYNSVFDFIDKYDWTSSKAIINAEDVASFIIQNYGQLSHMDRYLSHVYTMSAIRLQKIAYLTQSVDLLAKELIKQLSRAKTEELRTTIRDFSDSTAIEKIELFGNHKTFLDLGHFSKLIQLSDKTSSNVKRAAKTITNIINARGQNSLFINEFHSLNDPGHPNATGLTIFLPLTEKPNVFKGYNTLHFFNNSWVEFLKYFVNLKSKFDFHFLIEPSTIPLSPGSTCEVDLLLTNLEELSHTPDTVEISVTVDKALETLIKIKPSYQDSIELAAKFEIQFSNQLLPITYTLFVNALHDGEQVNWVDSKAEPSARSFRIKLDPQ